MDLVGKIITKSQFSEERVFQAVGTVLGEVRRGGVGSGGAHREIERRPGRPALVQGTVGEDEL